MDKNDSELIHKSKILNISKPFGPEVKESIQKQLDAIGFIATNNEEDPIVEKLKIVSSYECTDGSVFKDKSFAIKHQKELEAKHMLAFLVQDNFSDDDVVDEVFYFMWENRYKIGELFDFK